MLLVKDFPGIRSCKDLANTGLRQFALSPRNPLCILSHDGAQRRCQPFEVLLVVEVGG